MQLSRAGAFSSARSHTPLGDHGADAGAGCFAPLGSREKLSEDGEGGRAADRKQ